MLLITLCSADVVSGLRAGGELELAVTLASPTRVLLHRLAPTLCVVVAQYLGVAILLAFHVALWEVLVGVLCGVVPLALTGVAALYWNLRLRSTGGVLDACLGRRARRSRAAAGGRGGTRHPRRRGSRHAPPGRALRRPEAARAHRPRPARAARDPGCRRAHHRPRPRRPRRGGRAQPRGGLPVARRPPQRAVGLRAEGSARPHDTSRTRSTTAGGMSSAAAATSQQPTRIMVVIGTQPVP